MKKGLKRQLRDFEHDNDRLRAIVCAILTEAGGDLELPDPPKIDFRGFKIARNEKTEMLEVSGVK